MRRFAIFGTGGMGRELVAPARAHLRKGGPDDARELVFVSDDPGADVMGIAHLHADELRDDDEVVIALGSSAVRKAVSERLKARFASLVAPTALIGPDVAYGDGSVFCDYSMVTASVRIGGHFQCNVYSCVMHDCVIGDYVTFAPRVTCNGNVHIGDGAYIGAGAVLKNGTPERPLIVGSNAVVGMGAVVTKDVPEGAVVVGNPARPLVRR